jgi:exosome complex component RRP43
VLYVDATCINYDGNVFDAALIAMMAALRNSVFIQSSILRVYICSLLEATFPKATYNAETGLTTCSRAAAISLQILKTPVSFSFGVFDEFVVALSRDVWN